ncbi:MAG: protein arginine kinase [Verrucomicrobiae bacterium]|nr:protein arginine kinase [Verrucomicrobiae bacterium]
MSNDLHSFLSLPADTVRKTGPMDQIVLSSRVRLARNIQGFAFPGWAKKSERVRSLDIIRSAVEQVPVMTSGFADSMDSLSSMDKQILVERHLISREHAAKSGGSGLVLDRLESLSVMINEEDHLRMQSLRPGLQLREAWQAVDEMDSALEARLPYAFSPDLGFLTACPTNVGTGIRVSAMLHLPGLVLTELINSIVQSVNKLGLAVRGLYGEGTEALGNIFQVSNQMTLGESELEIVERLSKVVHQMIEHELNARQKLLEEKPKVLFNHVGRAFGILANAHSISSKEAMNLLSLVRLAHDFKMFPTVPRALFDELLLVTQPAHLQRAQAGKLAADERDIRRADLLRDRLAETPRPVTAQLTPPEAGDITPPPEPPPANDAL